MLYTYCCCSENPYQFWGFYAWLQIDDRKGSLIGAGVRGGVMMTKPGWQCSVINVTLTYQRAFPALNTNQKPRIEFPRNQQNGLGGSPAPFLPVHYIKTHLATRD